MELAGTKTPKTNENDTEDSKYVSHAENVKPIRKQTVQKRFLLWQSLKTKEEQ